MKTAYKYVTVAAVSSVVSCGILEMTHTSDNRTIQALTTKVNEYNGIESKYKNHIEFLHNVARSEQQLAASYRDYYEKQITLRTANSILDGELIRKQIALVEAGIKYRIVAEVGGEK